ncbi:MAG TPA: sugar ABC transporter substrate-binding protein [Thermomicrobiales bacterium]|jgi:multiple sugar transport system substrate-binding protein|nr:sugar ABC transporter substrate-binding protein [Thermomicrobiales bacterium]
MWHHRDRDRASDARFAEYLDDLNRNRMDRRTMFRRGAMIGLSAAAIAGLDRSFQPRASAQGKTQIRLGVWAGVDEANELAEVIAPINAAATDFEILSEPKPADYYVQLQTTIAGGTAPDLFWLSQEYVPNYASNGAILDITERLASDSSGIGAANVDDYLPAPFRSVQYEDKTWGLPWLASPVMLYYNPALFEAAGLPLPDDTMTWETFREAARALTLPDQQQYGIAFGEWPPIQMFIWQAGGEVITEDLSECPIDSAEAIQGAQFKADLTWNPEYGMTEAQQAEQSAGDLMKAGRIGMFLGGATDDFDYAQQKDPAAALIRVARVPQGPAGRQTLAYTASTVINGASANPDAAYNALVALTEGIHHWKIVAPRQSLANVETVSASVPGKAESAATIVAAATEDMRPFNVIPQQSDWDQSFFDYYVDPLYRKEGTAEELAPDARAELESWLP